MIPEYIFSSNSNSSEFLLRVEFLLTVVPEVVDCLSLTQSMLPSKLSVTNVSISDLYLWFFKVQETLSALMCFPAYFTHSETH